MLARFSLFKIQFIKKRLPITSGSEEFHSLAKEFLNGNCRYAYSYYENSISINERKKNHKEITKIVSDYYLLSMIPLLLKLYSFDLIEEIVTLCFLAISA
jgi:hypothetical protein